jgi:arylsulfatase A-like enzyme
MLRDRPTDVIVIVLDCVSAKDFVAGSDPAPGLRTCESLAKEGRVYSHAIAPASWTIPSHASMFTGAYPWEAAAEVLTERSHMLHGATIADGFRSEGFRTASFSGNPYISPLYGLNRGFEVSLWGEGFSDCILRKVTRWTSTPHTIAAGEDRPQFIDRFSKERRSKIAGLLLDYPLLADISTRFAARILNGGMSGESLVAPWIESSVEEWISKIPADEDLFCFINLLDAHEPYIGVSQVSKDIGEWFESLVVPQRERDRVGDLLTVSSDLSDRLRQAYRKTISLLDQRIGRILAAFQSHRDWDNCCVVVTSDHGQAFGEGGLLFHAKGTPDSVHRIPLIVKPVRAAELSDRPSEWVSLTRLPSVLAAASGARLGRNGGSVEFVKLTASAENGLALSLADGIRGGRGTTDPNGRTLPSMGPAIVGYSGRFKVVLESGSRSPRVYSMSPQGVFLPSTDFQDAPSASELAAKVLDAVAQFEIGNGAAPRTDVARNLRNWGYE